MPPKKSTHPTPPATPRIVKSLAPAIAAKTAQKRSRRKAESYLVAAEASSTVRAYTADWKHFCPWCAARQQVPMPATPELVGDYLSDLGEGCARATLRREVAAIARAIRLAGHPLDPATPRSRDVLRGIGRTHVPHLN